MNKAIRLFFLLGLILLLSACRIQNEYADDFSSQNNWTTFEEDAGVVGYSYEYFRIAVNQPDTFLWTQAGGFFRNVGMSVEAAQIGGSSDNYFGLLCRIQEDGSFYAGLISSDGFFSIQKRNADGVMTLLTGSHWGIDDSLAGEPPLKLIRFECNGDILRLVEDQNELAVVRDAELSGGDIGMIAGTFEGSSVEILFDEFLAIELAP